MKRIVYLAVQVFEYLISLIFILDGFSIFFTDKTPNATGVVGALVIRPVLIFYATTFVIVGVALIYSKITKKRHIHGWCLLIMYLYAVYASILDALIDGLRADLIINGCYALLLGALYLRWKYVVPDLERKP